jgi:type VI secretion system protein VasD
MLDPLPNRRAFLATSAAAALLAACGGPPGPATVTVAASGEAGMNRGPDGADRPVTVSILRLKDAGAFNSADYFALQEDAAGALGVDLLGMDQIAVPPGGSVSKTVSMEPEATSLGLMASLRDPAGKTWRTVTPIAPGSTVTVTASLGPSGLAVSTS